LTELTEDGLKRGPSTKTFVDLFFRPGEWLLVQFSKLDHASPYLWIVGFFLVQTIPATLIRAANLEEGRIIAIARGAMEDGHWLTPFVYGERFAERPVLLSWVAALFGEASGGVTLWSLRTPHLCIFFAGALLIYQLLRSRTGQSAAIFGALCWITMPMVAAKFINAEPDIVLSTLLFAAFCVWWNGTANGAMTLRRWLAVSALVGLAGLTKGPQPVAYFTLGVGLYLLLKRRDQIPAFLAANLCAGVLIGSWYAAVYQSPADMNLWMVHSRLMTVSGLDLLRDHLDLVKSIALEWLPATILIGPAIVLAGRRWQTAQPDLLLAAILYSGTCTLALILWPGGVAGRYAMPATMTLAVVCGLMFERLRASQPRIVASTLFVCSLIFSGMLARAWIAMPLWPRLFQESRTAGEITASFLQQPTNPLYIVVGRDEYNMLAYVKGPIRAVTLDDMARLDAGAVAVLATNEQKALSHLHPELHFAEGPDLGLHGRLYRIVGASR
jgi:4-amino-4-deoxy-L-arabinose transferase-like glycosyltransferase